MRERDVLQAVDSKLLKKDVFGRVSLIHSEAGPLIRRDTRDAPAALRWIARYLLARETREAREIDSTLLKKRSMAFSTSPYERRSHASLRCAELRPPVWQRGFQKTLIFNGLQPSKMPVRPCTARSLSKNKVFQQATPTVIIALLTQCLMNEIRNGLLSSPQPGRSRKGRC